MDNRRLKVDETFWSLQSASNIVSFLLFYRIMGFFFQRFEYSSLGNTKMFITFMVIHCNIYLYKSWLLSPRLTTAFQEKDCFNILPIRFIMVPFIYNNHFSRTTFIAKCLIPVSNFLLYHYLFQFRPRIWLSRNNIGRLHTTLFP